MRLVAAGTARLVFFLRALSAGELIEINNPEPGFPPEGLRAARTGSAASADGCDRCGRRPGCAVCSRRPADRGGWQKGDRLAFAFRNQQGAEVQADFQAGATRPSSFRASAPQDAGQTETHIAAGTLPYFLFATLYDDQRHLIGLKRR